MSFSVNGSNANNPFALWQSLLQPGLFGEQQRAVRSDRVAVVGAGPRPRHGHQRDGSGGRCVRILDERDGDVGQLIAAIRRANPADAVRHAGQ